MKINMPVTDQEIHYEEHEILVSKTDLKGAISYVNRDFIRISGFTEAELLGKNHNIVRHPDMPPEAFEDLWSTVKEGKPWVGLVKNRCKNGDYYWVQANVTPVMQNDQVVEYMSVRSKPTREQVAQAEKLYRDIRDKKASLEGNSSAKLKAAYQNLSIKKQLILMFSIIIAALGISAYEAQQPVTFVLCLISILASIITLGITLKTIFGRLDSLHHHMLALTQGNFNTQVPIHGRNEIATIFQAVKSIQIKVGFDVVDANARAADGARIKQALDSVSANVMVADADRNIIYMNDAVIGTLRNAQSDLRKDLPNFDVDKLLGESIDHFHKNPSHQKGLLERLTTTYDASIVIGGRHMDLSVNPVRNDQGVRLGTVVEWTDRTAEIAIEKEIDSLVAAAANGDMSKRISVEDKTGFFASLSKGLNELVSASASFVDDIGQVFASLAEGDLSRTVDKDYKGDFERIKQDANTTISKLTSIISRIRESANTVHTAANEIAQGNLDLSQRTEEQASSLEETASSMEQITATVKQSADNASEANRMAVEAKNKAQQGGVVVKDAVKAMGEILDSSNKINDIIGVIDEIAFQTNLLALNAAVEAARAGEQGRGFAVVAGEVRNLSQRSAAAAKEIKDLIRDSVSKVETGSSLVNHSGETLSSIVHAIERVAQVIDEVNGAAREQTSGIEQINQAVAQMDEMTQQNAALVEEASAASEAMSEQASTMNRLISFFQIGEDTNDDELLTSRPQKTRMNTSSNKQRAGKDASLSKKQAAQFSNDDEWEDF